MLLVKVSFVTMYLRRYLIVGKNPQKNIRNINAVDGALTENLNFSQTFSFRFYTLLVGYHLLMMFIQRYLIVGKKILQTITCELMARYL